MYSGCHWSSRPLASSAARSSGARLPFLMYHCLVVTISSGIWPYSKNFTACRIGSGSPRTAPAACSRSVTRDRAAFAVRPASCAYASRPASLVIAAGAAASSRPSLPITGLVASCRSRHQVTSVMSPNVHTITSPVPFAGSASRCARTGTSVPNRGVRTVVPNRGWYRSSSG